MAGNAAYAYSWFIDHGFSRNAAAGIVGNLVQESGVNPHSNQVGGPGRGIAQWSEGERWSSLVAWANRNGHDPEHLDTQLQWLMIEMRGLGMVDKMKGMVNRDAATRYFMNVFERPDPRYANLSGRMAFATQIRERNLQVPTSAKKNQGGNGGGGNNGGGGGGNGNGGNPHGNYGFVDAFLDEHAQIDQLVAKGKRQGWTNERFAAELKDTDWWQNKTKAQRQWDLLLSEQPKEAQRQVNAMSEDIATTASNLGVDLGGNELKNLAEKAVRNGLSEAELGAILGHKFQLEPQQANTGQGGLTVDALRARADAYGIHLDRGTVERMTRNVLQGDMTVEGLEDRLREQAKTLYPNIGQLLDGGQTVRDVLEPYLNIASNELGIPVEQMKTADSKWSRFLSGQDGMPMNADQATVAIRTDKRYGWDTTLTADEQAAGLRGELAKRFGVSA